MSPHWQMYLKPKYVQDDAVWVDRGAEQPVKGQVLLYIGHRTYEVALSSQGVRVIQEQALSLRTKDERR
jgi:hypothetical protein